MVRVLVVADIRLYLEGLAESLGRRTGITVVGMAHTADVAISLSGTLLPDVVLIDRALSGGLAAIREIHRHLGGIRAIALGVQDCEDDVLECAEAGISAYVPRDASLEDVARAIQLAARGEALCSPRVAAALLRRIATGGTPADDASSRSPLTARETEIVSLIGQRLTNKEIGARLGIEVATVKNHVHNLLEKLQVRRRTDAPARLSGRSSHQSVTPRLPAIAE
jgi:two-component system nitrate/nitrite response regulator NarL